MKGAKTAAISFTAPSKTIGGAALASITSIDILRNGDVIKSYTSPAVGSCYRGCEIYGQGGICR